ncbi:hypothetical protein F4815DRAFT_490238 [Daldinia loculata]|nr:hypothetical protein F4815DRAFT_490238 [Daldinia loculata]
MEDGKGLFTRSAERMRWAKSWYLSKLPIDSSIPGAIATAPMIANEMEYETWQILFA